LRDMIVTVTIRWGPLAAVIKYFFALSGLTPFGAILLVILIGAIEYVRGGKSKAAKSSASQSPTRRWLNLAGVSVVLLLLPPILGTYFSEILDNVGMYILMGLGLNIVVGFAGLLDLGYVAFFAIGAYVMGVLTSPELGFFHMTYWQALPFALVACVAAGFILGLPVLKMRGDYLAIVTLGFGEIVRLLALSDWLRPWLGGTQGIQKIAQPQIGPFLLNSQQELYYLFLIGIGIVAFIATRLKDSRIGRAWMALREDEDVAVAMGINHVMTKLMAFATGALFSGLAGTIFAAKLTSVYPHSMNFMVSINVLCLIIIGGMGSIPGVFVGALLLIGAPELLREFAEYRYLVYGALLVIMMLTKPEGLWPEERRRLELHEKDETKAVPLPDESASQPAARS
jgi:branched-chain amino acid transport system permease protein